MPIVQCGSVGSRVKREPLGGQDLGLQVEGTIEPPSLAGRKRDCAFSFLSLIRARFPNYDGRTLGTATLAATGLWPRVQPRKGLRRDSRFGPIERGACGLDQSGVELCFTPKFGPARAADSALGLIHSMGNPFFHSSTDGEPSPCSRRGSPETPSRRRKPPWGFFRRKKKPDSCENRVSERLLQRWGESN